MASLNDSFNNWFTYNHEANELLIWKVASISNTPEKAIHLLSHILNSHDIWLSRLYPDGKPLTDPWAVIPSTQMIHKNEDNFSRTKLYLQSERFGMAFNKSISYRNSRGMEFTNTVQEVYFHLLSHSAYHRGQVATILRQNNQEPINTDFIHLQRIKALG